MQRFKEQRGSARRQAIWAAGVWAFGSWAGTAIQAQTAGDLRVPDYLTGQPANRPNGMTVGGDASREFQNLPGQPYQGPIGPTHIATAGMRSLTYSFFAGLEVSYIDNGLLTADGNGRNDDLTISPSLGANVGYAPTEHTRLDMHFGVTYRYSINYRPLTQISIIPNSVISYQLMVGQVALTFYNRTSTSANNRPELAGNNTASGVDLNRVSNSTGLTATWVPTEDLSVSGGYTFLIDRGLNDSFGILDQTSHILNAGVYERLSPYWTVGLSSQVAFTQFVQQFQNDGTSYSAGPVVSFHPNRYISASASVGYQISQYSSNASVNDTRDFHGVIWNVSVSHQLTPQLTHSVSAGSGTTTGLGSNFTESLQVSYSIGWQFHPAMGLNAGFTYMDITQSGKADVLVLVKDQNGDFVVPATVSFNDAAESYDFHIGTGYQFTSRLRSSLSYFYRLRQSRFDSRSYNTQSITLSLGYTF